MREELQCGGCRRIRTGAAGPHVEDVGGRRREGGGRREPDAADHSPRGGRGGKYGAASSEGEVMHQHEAVEAETARRGFDTQSKTGDGGRPALMVTQQVERTTVLQDQEVRAELNRRVHECERKCYTGGRLGSIPQASARARQQATREQVKSQWCESRAEAAHRRCNQARRSYRRLRGCADRVSAAHAREQWRLSCEQENPEVRGEVGLANQSGSIVSSHCPRHPTVLTPRG
jgi:hypothetical protein